MKSIIVSLLGKDKPGIVERIAKQVRLFEGNWLASNFAHMAGHFTGFVEIQLPQKKITPLLEQLDSMPELNIRLVEGETSPAQAIRASLEIMGNDKPGIVQEITSVLHQFNINILRFSSSCEAAPNWGGLLFKANIDIDYPEGFDIAPLSLALEQIANDLVVDIDWQE
ncbi:ACT domain-containing protein [Lacimicrobium sp. SS2-24]|uniref:glycine cleavage system protein R n=1 Tax=Lacimicrobium sp. SS2-24 TaxID=2005569 RepID=UPI000B4AA430|nr:ACT domain-containing protein [Lacimicrobium sp. SS2-24]